MPSTGSGTGLRLDLSDGRLWNGDRAIPLTPTAFSMLRYFVLHPNRLLTKQEILDNVWPHTHVTEGLIKDYVKRIRRSLGDDPKQPCFIETARGLGYRYVGDVEVIGVAETSRPAAAEHASIPTIAVLPFSNSSGDVSQEYFSDGIAEDIIIELSRFRSLFVIARDSTFLYRDRPTSVDRVGRDLGAQYVVEGSVRKAGTRIRITVRLIEAASGLQLWAERYDRELSDVFAVQDEIVGSIVSTLVGRLEDSRRRRNERHNTGDLAAYDYLLRGDHCLNRRQLGDVFEARELYRLALEREPGSARAHAGLALSFVEELWSDWTAAPEAAAEQCLALARKAVALDEFDSRARVALAAAYHFAKFDFQRAEIQYNKALELNPNDSWGHCLKGWLLALSGDADRALACIDTAIRLSPADTYDCRIAQFLSAYTMRQYDEALLVLGDIDEATNLVRALLGACYAQLGRDSEAREAMADFMAAANEIRDYPGEDCQDWRRFWLRRFPFKDPVDLNHLLEGFDKAGLPVGAAP